MATQVNYLLIDFLKTFGINTTTNFDLYSIADFLNLDLDVCMKNETRASYVNKNFIFNYQNQNQKGTHWVAFSDGFYFDSFGLKPLENIEKFEKKYNKIQVQHFDTKICGILCIYFLYKIKDGTGFDEIILEMKNLYYQLIKE